MVLNSGAPLIVVSVIGERGGNHEMKFLAVLCLLALAAADDDKLQDKKPQPIDATQNASTLTQPPATLLNGQVFPQTTFPNVFAGGDPNLALAGFSGNVSPIQTINPDFFASTPAANVNAPVPTFPVTRTVLPGTSGVVNGIQTAFPVAGNVFPAVAAVPNTVNPIQTQFPGGILSTVTQGAFDPNTASGNGAISQVPVTAYRFVTPEALSGVATQGLQTVQQVGLAAIPAFTSGILPNGVLQGQNIPAIQQVLKNPTGNPAGIVNVPGLTGGNISSGPLTNVFRHA